MRRPTSRDRIARRLGPCALAGALILALALASPGRVIRVRSGTEADAGGPEPGLPGAVTKAPDWIGADAPFDVVTFFAPIPRDRNAAPLYLDALFEFSPEVAACFPEGPERDRRRRAAEDRIGRYAALSQDLLRNPKAVTAESIDSVIGLHEAGFRKLAEAQRRDRCIFEDGYGHPTVIPAHCTAARQVARIAQQRVRRAIERGDLDGALRDVEAVLRLARDLRPRGAIVNQLVATAIEAVAGADMIPRILADRGLRVEHCDRLLVMLLEHEARSSDGYAEGLRGEYLSGRFAFRDLAGKQALSGADPAAALDRAVRGLNEDYRRLLGLDGVPFARRLATISTLRFAGGDDAYSRIIDQARPSIAGLAQTTGRVTSVLRADESIIVMRRWGLRHRGLPRALAVPAREAGLKSIPIDPYDGRPMRVGVFEGRTVVYSVGKDGRDDGGRTDSQYDTQPGDLIYRVPAVE